jgi:hypothetical protein
MLGRRGCFSPRLLGTAVAVLLLVACRTAEGETLYRSDEFHLEVNLPAGWAATEGPERLARPFVGLVAFNSWGEPGFWAPEVATATAKGTSYSYGPDDVLGQIPADGAYVVLLHFGGGPRLPAEEYGPEHERQDVGDLWEPSDCREGGMASGVTYAHFFKWGRLLRLEAYCGQDASDATAVAVNELLASFRFDRVPAGDAGWAVTEARRLLPPAAEPAKFPVPPGSFQSVEQQGSVVRITQAEVEDETVVVTFMYRWDEPLPGSDAEDCPPDRCHWWRFEARPSGEVLLIEEGGAFLPGGVDT